MTIDVNPEERSAVGSVGKIDFGPLAVRPAHVFSIPASQRYYWTEAWQEGEQETLRELREGKGIRFSSGQDLVRWLLSDEPDGEDSGGATGLHAGPPVVWGPATGGWPVHDAGD